MSDPITNPHDDELAETDSAIGSNRASLTETLSSSIYNYRFENGRRYHAYKDGTYPLPNDEDEADRLDLQHHTWKLTLDGKLYLAPILPSIQSALDIGTGTGIWPIEFADAHPSAHVIGTDLSPIQPSFVPPNCSFMVDDAEADWEHGEQFDFIHARMLTLALRDWPRFFKQSFDALKPGGWLECHEGQLAARCDDGTVGPETALQRWTLLMREAAMKMSVDIMATENFSSLISEQGFVNLSAVPLKWPLGPWPTNRKERRLGKWVQQNILGALQGASMALFTRELGWSRDKVELFLSEVRNDIHNPDLHAYFQVYVHYAQKPQAA